MIKFDLSTGILFFCPKNATIFPDKSVPPSNLRLHGNTYLVGNSRAAIALLCNARFRGKCCSGETAQHLQVAVAVVCMYSVMEVDIRQTRRRRYSRSRLVPADEGHPSGSSVEHEYWDG